MKTCKDGITLPIYGLKKLQVGLQVECEAVYTRLR